MTQKRDNKGSALPDSLRSRLFNPQEARTPNPGATTDAARQKPSAPPSATRARPTGDSSPTIGVTMTLKGDLVGNENCAVLGKFEGSVILKENDIVIEESGQIEGSIVAKHVLVKGRVNGEINGLDKVTIAATGCVQGTIAAPRVALEDGGKFKGMIDMPMDDQSAGAKAGKTQEPGASAPKRAQVAEAGTGS